MQYPGKVIQAGSTDAVAIKAIRARLAALGYEVSPTEPAFDAPLVSTLKLFQSLHVDLIGRPLTPDGKVGPMTWGALFGAPAAPLAPAATPAALALAKAISQIGVMEVPAGSNWGPEVKAFLAAAGLNFPAYWCMAFVYWCFKTSAEEGGAGPTLFPKTAGCLDAWNRVKKSHPTRVITRAQAIKTPTLVRPGAVFILDFGGGHGHTGFVREAVGGALRTVEGNTNPAGSGNGVGVFELTRRNVMAKELKGFLDFN